MGKLRIGDKVIVRDWDAMVEEYGVDEGGDIINKDAPAYFDNAMKEFCGQTGTVLGVEDKMLRLFKIQWDDQDAAEAMAEWYWVDFMFEVIDRGDGDGEEDQDDFWEDEDEDDEDEEDEE